MRVMSWLRAIVPALALATPLSAAAQGEVVVSWPWAIVRDA